MWNEVLFLNPPSSDSPIQFMQIVWDILWLPSALKAYNLLPLLWCKLFTIVYIVCKALCFVSLLACLQWPITYSRAVQTNYGRQTVVTKRVSVWPVCPAEVPTGGRPVKPSQLCICMYMGTTLFCIVCKPHCIVCTDIPHFVYYTLYFKMYSAGCKTGGQLVKG